MFDQNKNCIWSSYPVVLAALSRLFDFGSRAECTQGFHIKTPKIKREGCPCTFKNQVSCLGNSSIKRSELGLFSVSITLHGFKCCSALFASFWLIRHILSPFFFFFSPPYFICFVNWAEASHSLSVFTLPSIEPSEFLYNSTPVRIFEIKGSPSLPLSDDWKWDGSNYTKKNKKKKLSQLCLRIVRYKCTYCHPVREGLHYNLRKIRTPKMQVEMRTMGSSLLKIEIVIIGTNLMRQNVLLVSANILTNRSDPPRMNRGLVCKHVAWLRRDWVREGTRLLPARSRTPGVLWGICTWLERFNLMPFLLSPPWLRGLSVHF